MLNVKTDTVFELVKSMTKSEKRLFRIFVERLENSPNAKFMALFDAMDAEPQYNETHLLKKTGIAKEQLSNIKNYLMQQLLASLRQSTIHIYDDISLRSQLDFARILYSKGIYGQCLSILEKAKTQAQRQMQPLIELEIVELEKLVRTQHTAGITAESAAKLSQNAHSLLDDIQKTSEFSNFAMQLYALLLQRGQARNLNDIHFIEDFYQKNRPKISADRNQSLREQLYMNLSNYWYHFIAQDFSQCCKYAQSSLTIFESAAVIRNHLPALYFKTYSLLLKSLFFLQSHRQYREILQNLEQTMPFADQTDASTKIDARCHYFTGVLNLHFMEGSFTKALGAIEPLILFLETYRHKIDPRRTTLFYYKIACLHFGCGNYAQSLVFLNKIDGFNAQQTLPEIRSFACILTLIASYENGAGAAIKPLIKSAQGFLSKIKNINALQREFLHFINHSDAFLHQNSAEKFRDLYLRILPYENHPYEKRLFMYLDFTAWLESKFQKITVENFIQKRFHSSNTEMPVHY